MPPQGAELSHKSPENLEVNDRGGAKTGALDDVRLGRLIELWPKLRENIKVRIDELLNDFLCPH
jgi:hypothetical protein